ncbi:hypothetical protein A9179_15830 [Pseudomonas alcaligenes]|uniref:Uncharacterized protein n=1 Tax=Aquipseudomonas alcaligenes TaxID=43263 RepID=A0ABR7S2C7_AQUAC|nr:hypothetical protein [Pseudomonas alcaligenes]MBC9251741.1 hypothetical protein [Pseudomonas alcaligenes]
MSSQKGKVVPLHPPQSDEALERLNRITGLRFARWPQSLVPQARQATEDVVAVDEGASVVRFGVF